MRYFVTGATGFIGGRVARCLLDAGHDVIALVRDPDRAAWLAEAGAVLARGDITEADTMRGPMAGVDGVFHLAAWYRIGARDRREAERINVEGTRNVLGLMRDLEVPKGVYTSTVAVFSDTKGAVRDESHLHSGPFNTHYEMTKWRAHLEVAKPMADAGLPLVIVQPGLVYGPGDPSLAGQTFRDYLRGRLPGLPAGTGYSMAHVDDVARGHVLAMERGRPGETYLICGPPTTLSEVFRVAEKVTGVPAPKRTIPAGLMRVLAAALRPVAALVPLPEQYAPESLRVMAGTTYYGDDTRARRELGFATRPLEEGLRDLFESLQD